jgi:hypothetical protein
MAEKKAVSLLPSEATGMFDNARAVVVGAKFGGFKANSGADMVNLVLNFKAADGKDIEERYLVGNAAEWTPTKDGYNVINEAGGTLWNKSLLYQLFKSFVDSGFPEANLVGGVKGLIGADVHLVRTPTGGTYIDGKGKERVRASLFVTKVYGTAAVKGVKAAAAKAAPAAAAEASSDVDAYATEVLKDILALPAHAGGVNKEGLKVPVFQKLTKDKKLAQRPAVLAKLNDDAFLADLAENGIINFDGETIVAA